jgi:dUTP pyrophosphatase
MENQNEYFKGFPNNSATEIVSALINNSLEEANKQENQFDINEWFKNNAPKGNVFVKHQLGFLNESGNEDPQYATEGASGFDLRSNADMVIPAGTYNVVPTGLFFHIPAGFEIQVRPRSGLAAKYGVTVLNSPGTIDADYRGELKVILINHGEKDFEIVKGDRIAQGICNPVTAKAQVTLQLMNIIDGDTERGSDGFGSTGVK